MAPDAVGVDFRPLVVRALHRLADAGHRAPDLKSFERDGEKNGRVIHALVAYLDELSAWNARVDLTAARSPEEAVDLALADAVILAHYGGFGSTHAEPPRWVDVGAGAGAPGLILALLRPDWAMTLVEPRTKRVAFLRSVIGRLNIKVDVRRMRSEELEEKRWDIAVSRATLSAEAWLEEGTRLARHAVWVLLARGDVPACAGWRALRDISYEWPLTSVPRRAICYVPEPDR